MAAVLVDSRASAPAPHAGPWRRAWRRLRRRRGALAGLTVVMMFVALALFAPWIAPHDPLDQDLASAMQPPFGLAGGDVSHILGSDDLGRDALSRLIFGSRVALSVSITAALLAATIGTMLGLLAGYVGGWVDRLISRVVEIWLAFPAVPW